MAAARKWPDERREGRGVEGVGCLEEVRKAGGISYGLELSVYVCWRERLNAPTALEDGIFPAVGGS